MIKLLTCLAAVVSCLSYLPSASACSCAAPPPPKQALEGSAAVFSGKVVKIVVDEKLFTRHVTIEVAAVWKGQVGKQITVSTALHGETCGYGFQKDQSYLIYCYSRKGDNENDPVTYWTNICTRTRPMANAAADIKAIGEGKKPVSQAKSD